MVELVYRCRAGFGVCNAEWEFGESLTGAVRKGLGRGHLAAQRDDLARTRSRGLYMRPCCNRFGGG